MEVLDDLVGMFALSVGMHHDHAALPDQSFQLVFNLDRRNRRVRIARDHVPQNEPKAEGSNHVDGIVVEFPIGRAKQGCPMTVLGIEETNRAKDFLFLLLWRMEWQMGMDVPMGTDFKEWNLEEGVHLLIMLRDPFSGHEEGRGDLVLDQIVDQFLIVARPVSHRAEVEREGYPRAGWRARLDHLGLQEARRRQGEQDREGQAQDGGRAARLHGDKYTRFSR